MNKYLIAVVVSVLAFLVGCKSELPTYLLSVERCIEANMKEHGKSIEYKKWLEDEGRKESTKLCHDQGIY